MRGEGWEGGAFCWAPIMAICGVQFQSGAAVSFIVFSDRKNSSILWRDILHLAIKEIQVIITMILLTRSSERIFNSSHFNGNIFILQVCAACLENYFSQIDSLRFATTFVPRNFLLFIAMIFHFIIHCKV